MVQTTKPLSAVVLGRVESRQKAHIPALNGVSVGTKSRKGVAAQVKNKGHIDPTTWPNLVREPSAPMMGARASAVHDRLEEFLDSVDISVPDEPIGIGDIDPEPPIAYNPEAIFSSEPMRMSVYDPNVMNRMVDSGFLGLGEGYVAGAWDAVPLADVLATLLDHDIEAGWGKMLSRWSRNKVTGVPRAGELPLELIELCTGPSKTWGSPLFATSSRTSVTETLNWKNKTTIVDVTRYESPQSVSYDDIESAQYRRVNQMLDECRVGPGSRVLEFPASSATLAVTAARRGATVDVLTSDPVYAEDIRRIVREEKLAGAVHVETISGPIPSPRQWSGVYDAIMSVERMETMGIGGLRPFLRAIGRMLSPGGRACIQSVINTGLSENSLQALGIMRGYVWPALEYPTVENVRDALMRYTDLVERAEVHCGDHLRVTLPLWRREFAINRDAAAAAGFDRVYRRLWFYVLALQEALFMRGELDVAQFVLLKPKKSE